MEATVPFADTPQFMEKYLEGVWNAHDHSLNVIFLVVYTGES